METASQLVNQAINLYYLCHTNKAFYETNQGPVSRTIK